LPQAQQLPQNNHPPQETHTNYHDHAQNQDQELIKELRAQNASQAELITQQRIRIAVQYNELKHINKAKADAVNALVMFAQTCGSSPGLTDGTQDKSSRRAINESSSNKEEEIKKLKDQLRSFKAQNELLWDLSNPTLNCLRTKVDSSIQESASDEGAIPPKTLSRRKATPFTPSRQRFPEIIKASDMIAVDDDILLLTAKEKGKGKERMVDSGQTLFGGELHGASSDHNEKKRRGEGLRQAFKKNKALSAPKPKAVEASTTHAHRMAQTSESEPETKHTSGCNESFTFDIPTVPNNPLLYSFSAPYVATSQPPDIFPVSNTKSDVGLQSLDDLLASDMNEDPNARQNQDNNKEEEKLPPMAKKNEQNIEAILPFKNGPAPVIRKTGFDMKNSKRGAEYDHFAPEPASLRGGMNNYGRFNTEPHSSATTSQLWSSPQERDGAILEHKRACGGDRHATQYPDYFRYGIQYTPHEDDENYLRAVSISNLPGDVGLRDVLVRVRGGQIIKAILMDTRRLMGGTMSAMVIFMEDYDAQNFVAYTAEYPITFGQDDEQRIAQVTLIPTPTYPMSPGMQKCVKSLPRKSRSLAISNVPQNLSLSRLERDLSGPNACRLFQLLEMYLDEEQTLHLEFSSVSAAGTAFAILTNWSAYYGLQVYHESDPCAGPLEELALPVPPRPPMLPRDRLPSTDSESKVCSSFEGLNERTRRLNGAGGVIRQQRKLLAALTNQKVVIPSFSGSGIKSSSWADEVNEESELSGNDSLSYNPINQLKLSLHSNNNEHEEQVESIDHPSVPPSSPHDGVPLKLNPGISVKEAVDKIMVDNLNAIMTQNPSFFKDRKPLVGLAGSKYATAVQGFEDRREPSRRGSGRCSQNESFTEEVEDSEHPSAANVGRPFLIQTPPTLKPLPELEPGSLLASAIYSESEPESSPPALSESESEHSSPTLSASQGESIRKASRSGNVMNYIGTSGNLIPYCIVPPALQLSHFTQEDNPLPAQEGKSLPRVPIPHPDVFRSSRTQSNTPFTSLPQQLPESGSSYTLPKPTFSPIRSPVQTSPTRQSKQLGQHSTPLADFNRAFETELLRKQTPPPIPFHTHPRNQIAPSEPTTPKFEPPRKQTAPRTPQNKEQNAEVYYQKVVREYYKGSEEVPEGGWTQQDIETLKKSSPKTKERYAKLIEMGWNVGQFDREDETKKVTSDSEDENEESDSFAGGGEKDGKGKGEVKVVEKGDEKTNGKAGEAGENDINMKVSDAKGKDMEKGKDNPDEIDLDLEDDNVGAG
jgi:hypothetical protein